MKKIFHWIIDNFSYVQIYVFICLLFLFSLLPIAYFWIATHLTQIALINEQLGELKEEESLKKIFNELQEHRLLYQRSLAGNKESQKLLNKLDKHIDETFKDAEGIKHLKEQESGRLAPLWQKFNPNALQNKWDDLKSKLPRLNPQENEILHTAFLHDVVIQFGYLGDRVGINYFEQFDKYVLVQSIFLRLASLQENLSQLSLLSEKILTNPSASRPMERLNSLIVLIESDLENLKNGIALHKENTDDVEHKEIIDTVSLYQNSVQRLVDTVKTRILSLDKPTIPFSEFDKMSEETVNDGILLWKLGLRVLTKIYQTEKEYIIFRLLFVLFLTIFLTSFAFFFGLALTFTGIKRLSKLTEATANFTGGNLTARVSDSYNDQIGRQAQAFNRMAEKSEAMIKHLYELVEATSALADGDLSARIRSGRSDPEFEQVALSFNKMAETFETIIFRLQQIGKMLTISASAISDASKDQETSVVKQEATTREIAVAASEISTTAKDFAKTMNEVSQTAVRTSDLALRGKGSLNGMELIMRSMVEASGEIAAKLADLNEKAGNITSVITTITKVADQTNLLSLNASIEAEKAGEYGRSFSVIAREIRRLADQTAISTLDIEKMVDDIMTAVTSSVIGVEDFTQGIRKGAEEVRSVGEQLAVIIEQVQTFIGRFEVVNQGMQAQSTGAEQINQAISSLSQTAAKTSEAIHQFHKTVQELNQAANELSIVNPFTQSIPFDELKK